MKIQSVNNSTSFNGKTAGKHDDYYKWLSQNQVNRRVVMSKGREVENGKMMAIGNTLNVVSWLGLIGSVLALAQNKAKSNCIGLGLAATSFVASISKEAVAAANLKKAQKTADERGVNMSILENKGGIKEVYKKTDEEYNRHLAK